jgi:regulatory protein
VTEARALAAAYAYLNRRERTESELRAHLEARELTEDEVQAAVTELTELGYLDDARYASLFVQDKRALEGWGAERIRRGLHERGVDRGLIEAALAAEAPEQELDRALELLRRRFPQPPSDRRDRDRALGMMIRKGFDSELALDALTAYAHE